jgi:hypothetical protein
MTEIEHKQAGYIKDNKWQTKKLKIANKTLQQEKLYTPRH